MVVLGTGGTIAGLAERSDENLRYSAAQVGVGDLLSGVVAPAGVAVETEQVAQIDSKDMDIATWLLLARRIAQHAARPDVAGLVVTHGTDTMEETAYFLSRVLRVALATGKPVVLTGAMRPASSRDADGPRNLADALSVAADAAVHGVVVVFAGFVHAAHDVRKVHPQRPDAFSSGEGGPLGSVRDGIVEMRREPGDTPADIEIGALPDGAAWPWVEIVTSAAGVDGRVVGLLAEAGVDGIVVAATGNGTMHHALATALAQASGRGIAVRRSTRCLDGAIVDDAADGFPSAGDLTPVKARIALMLDLLVDPGARTQPG